MGVNGVVLVRRDCRSRRFIWQASKRLLFLLEPAEMFLGEKNREAGERPVGPQPMGPWCCSNGDRLQWSWWWSIFFWTVKIKSMLQKAEDGAGRRTAPSAQRLPTGKGEKRRPYKITHPAASLLSSWSFAIVAMLRCWSRGHQSEGRVMFRVLSWNPAELILVSFNFCSLFLSPTVVSRGANDEDISVNICICILLMRIRVWNFRS